MRCRVSILLCVLLVCVAGFGALPVAGQPQTDGTHLEAQLQEDGDAEWIVTVRIPITDDREREEFEAFAERFETGQSDIGLGVDAFERAASEGSEATGREMEITSIERGSDVINETEDGEAASPYGVLYVSFTWESFARIGDDDIVYVDDAFNTTEGTWLPGLGADQSLTIKAPPEYGAPTTSPIGAEEGDLHWDGPATFEPGYFHIVYHPGSTEPVDEGNSTTLIGGALVLSGAALLVGIYLLVSRRRDGDGPFDEWATGSDDPEPIESSDTADDQMTGPGDTVGSEPPEPREAAGGESSRDLELLSDEERVEHLLEQNGGRMKQATIVKETGWSNAKVSQLLSAMDEDEQIDKLRIGRENLISLPGEGVGDLRDEGGER